MPSAQSYMIHASGVFLGEQFLDLTTYFPNLDLRADPMVKAALCAQIIALQNSNFRPDPRTATIGLTTKGCLNHIQKVVEAAAQNRSRTGFFVRSGPQTLATYSAMAHKTHGPTFSLVGSEMHLSDLFAIVDTLLRQKMASNVHLTFSNYDKDRGFTAGSLFVAHIENSHGWTLPTSLATQTVEEAFLELTHAQRR